MILLFFLGVSPVIFGEGCILKDFNVFNLWNVERPQPISAPLSRLIFQWRPSSQFRHHLHPPWKQVQFIFLAAHWWWGIQGQTGLWPPCRTSDRSQLHRLKLVIWWRHKLRWGQVREYFTRRKLKNSGFSKVTFATWFHPNFCNIVAFHPKLECPNYLSFSSSLFQ